MANGRTFWDALAANDIIQGIVTVGVIGTTLGMAACSVVVPEWLKMMSVSVLSYWFGLKTQKAIEAGIANRANHSGNANG